MLPPRAPSVTDMFGDNHSNRQRTHGGRVSTMWRSYGDAEMLGLVAAGHTNAQIARLTWRVRGNRAHPPRSEEHTSELQSRLHLVCRLLLEKKKYTIHNFKISS